MLPDSVERTLGPPQVTPVDVRTAIACPGGVKSVDALGWLLRESIEVSGCQHKEAAFSTGYAQDYWTRVLTGERGIVLDRLGRLPLAVQKAFVERWSRQLGLRVTTEDARQQAFADVAEAAMRALRALA